MRRVLPSSVVVTAPIWVVWACSASGPGVQRLELPVEDAHRSAIVVVARDGEPTPSLWAVDLAAATPLPIVEALSAADAVRVDSLLFEVSLPDLGLAAGRLEPAGAEATFTRPLPTPDDVFTSEVRDGAPGPWTASAAPPADVARVRLARAPRCGTPTVTDLGPVGPGELTIAVPWTRPGQRRPDTVLAGIWVRDANDDKITDFYLLDRAGVRPLTWTDPPQRFDAAHPGPDHSMLLTLNDGEVWRGTIDLETSQFSVGVLGFVTAHARARWVAGPPVATESLYLLTIEDVMGDEEPELADGILARYRLDDTPDTDLLYFEPDLKDWDNPGDMAWIGPEELVIVWPLDDGAVTRFTGGRVQVDPVADPRGVEHLDGWTTVVGTGDGTLLVPDETGWAALGQVEGRARRLAAAGDRIWVADAADRLHQIVPGIGLCETAIASPLRVEALVGFDGGLVVIGSEPGDGRRSARWHQL